MISRVCHICLSKSLLKKLQDNSLLYGYNVETRVQNFVDAANAQVNFLAFMIFAYQCGFGYILRLLYLFLV